MSNHARNWSTANFLRSRAGCIARNSSKSRSWSPSLSASAYRRACICVSLSTSVAFSWWSTPVVLCRLSMAPPWDAERFMSSTADVAVPFEGMWAIVEERCIGIVKVGRAYGAKAGRAGAAERGEPSNAAKPSFRT